MKQKSKKLIALVMAVLMIFGMLPISAAASDDLDGKAFLIKSDSKMMMLVGS